MSSLVYLFSEGALQIKMLETQWYNQGKPQSTPLATGIDSLLLYFLSYIEQDNPKDRER